MACHVTPGWWTGFSFTTSFMIVYMTSKIDKHHIKDDEKAIANWGKPLASVRASVAARPQHRSPQPAACFVKVDADRLKERARMRRMGQRGLGNLTWV